MCNRKYEFHKEVLWIQTILHFYFQNGGFVWIFMHKLTKTYELTYNLIYVMKHTQILD